MEISGAIQGVVKGTIVVAGNGQTWRVAILPATKVQVTGTATADSLRSGLIVEFTADLDGRGAIQGKVDTLTVTSLTKEKQMGLSPSDAGGGFGGKVIDDSPKPAKRTTHAAGKAGPRTQTAGSYRVIGRLMIGRGGALSVQPARAALPFALAEQPKVNVDMADLSLARPGHEISVKGFVSPRQPGMIQAAEVKVKLPEPQVAEKKEPAVKPEAKKPAKRSKKDQAEGLPEPGTNP